MPLLSFWKSNKDVVLKLTVEQVLTNAGDGSLRDNTECSAEFRQFLKMAPSEQLFSAMHITVWKNRLKRAALFHRIL
jgi:hypothetical protein